MLSGKLNILQYLLIVHPLNGIDSHPLGATGGRLLSSLIYELHRTGKQVGVATLCMGTGAGKGESMYNEEVVRSRLIFLFFFSKLATLIGLFFFLDIGSHSRS